MSFILWLAKRNRLLTLDKVAFLNKGSLCPLCSNEAESNAHLFFSCRKSLQVWAHIRDLAPFHKRFTSLQRITDSLIRGRSTSGVQGKLRCLAIAITVYCIWLSRNKLIFEDYQFSVIEDISFCSLDGWINKSVYTCNDMESKEGLNLGVSDRSQWTLFKEMHDECYNWNINLYGKSLEKWAWFWFGFKLVLLECFFYITNFTSHPFNS
ncbi:hypothetical protein GmHk_17G049671 [Glycine max]|nr:hypothetical protein GmHk_17G049671 [Glycine max]